MAYRHRLSPSLALQAFSFVVEKGGAACERQVSPQAWKQVSQLALQQVLQLVSLVLPPEASRLVLPLKPLRLVLAPELTVLQLVQA